MCRIVPSLDDYGLSPGSSLVLVCEDNERGLPPPDPGSRIPRSNGLEPVAPKAFAGRYLTFRALKDLEHRVRFEVEALSY